MTTIRLTLASLLLCGLLYIPGVHLFARTFFPENASGSLVKNPAGEIVGSKLIAQAFTSDRYFHSRPSSCDYNGQGACGSNLSPTNRELTARAREIISANRADTNRPIPADLVTASGSGLDPHITVAAARFQIERVAKARQLAPEVVEKLLPSTTIVNVLELNLALDAAESKGTRSF